MICNDCIHFEVCGIGKGLKTITECPYKRTDVVEVIRCKDCKYFEDVTIKGEPTGYGYCSKSGAMDSLKLTGDDFCSYGERKDK